ncbi:hypothetical protein GE09DRAFT_302347 [Coniochaeta sp. 2T2.1]|nr:hypothetical protein GE09DRAFT_302347 [Coniochaeta sp. 2T2.1]
MIDMIPPTSLPETRTSLRFLKYNPRFRFEKPFSIMFPGPLPNNAPKTNQEWETYEVPIYDVRDRKSEFTVEKNGFAWINAPSKAVQSAEDLDPETFMTLYVDETVELLEKTFHPDRIVCYDYRMRKNVPMNYDSLSSTSRKDPAPPVYTVHVDHSNDGGLDRARRHLTEEECAQYIDSGLYRCRCIKY